MAGITKLNAEDAVPGPQGQALAVEGEGVALRVWNEGPVEKADDHASDYETLGYVISGEAELKSGNDTLHLTPGDSWRVPKGVPHRYVIKTAFSAIEATSPPARGTSLGGHSTG
ncbi:hypothetical protein PB2503_09254 [Parvularcula bermudensis HTCC2503]|uniref:Cupin type-2 domain-containing protein n=1 Tax=Parvularcula bermudensis (strain ATCC BAA-594 / HTCC2503 / KCTC 12087) TaxID=314260 RepID=E0TD81_PARBH|nr:cupin domain-containing protein [Parvularcula bermudensis]ADM09904.1 hypothetical protein PB2503_09254 [Parvularcula bermudensis HTCC2503]